MLVFTTFKIKNLFNVKDAVPRGFIPVWFINFRVQVVMLVMLVKPANTSPHECMSTYFPTGLQTFLDICRV